MDGVDGNYLPRSSFSEVPAVLSFFDPYIAAIANQLLARIRTTPSLLRRSQWMVHMNA